MSADGVQLPTKAICNGWVKCKYKVLSSLLRLVTVDKYLFKSQPLQIAKRCRLPCGQSRQNEKTFDIFNTVLFDSSAGSKLSTYVSFFMYSIGSLILSGESLACPNVNVANSPIIIMIVVLMSLK